MAKIQYGVKPDIFKIAQSPAPPHTMSISDMRKSPITSWLQGVSPSTSCLEVEQRTGEGLGCAAQEWTSIASAMLPLRRIAGSFLPRAFASWLTNDLVSADHLLQTRQPRPQAVLWHGGPPTQDWSAPSSASRLPRRRHPHWRFWVWLYRRNGGLTPNWCLTHASPTLWPACSWWQPLYRPVLPLIPLQTPASPTIPPAMVAKQRHPCIIVQIDRDIRSTLDRSTPTLSSIRTWRWLFFQSCYPKNVTHRFAQQFDSQL